MRWISLSVELFILDIAGGILIDLSRLSSLNAMYFFDWIARNCPGIYERLSERLSWCVCGCVCEWTGECACMCKCVYVASLKRHMAFTDMDRQKERESGQKGKVNWCNCEWVYFGKCWVRLSKWFDIFQGARREGGLIVIVCVSLCVCVGVCQCLC